MANNGIPLGGLGSGKIEVFPNGCLGNFTFLNNQGFPLNDSDGVLGYHFCIYAKTPSVSVTKVLQTSPISDYPFINKIEYQGNFPFARLRYVDNELPIRIELECSSIFIPHKSRSSSLPCALFLFEIENPLDYEIAVSLLVTGRNIVGEWEVGRSNRIIERKGMKSIIFSNAKLHSYDETAGEIAISILGDETSFIEGWNMQRKAFSFNNKEIYLLPLECLSKEGRLPNSRFTEPLASESRQLGGALCSSFILNPKQRVQIPVIFTWYFPHHNEGHIYEKDFKDSFEVANELIAHLQDLHTQTKTWHKELVSSNLDEWLTDALVNNLYPLISGTLWNRRDEFACFEAPIVCPLMGTMDVRFYGSMALALLFPDLEMKEILQFANAQRPDGYIPHDLGKGRVDCPSNGTTPFFWKDLNPKFILLAYRDWLWFKDEGFLKAIYPSVKRALLWSISSDKNGDGLPDCEGQDQTFDMWQLRGNSSYVSGIFLASLLAAERLAQLLTDRAAEELCKNLFLKARANFEDTLFNGRYFILWQDKDQKDNSCMLAQLNGQWYAHLLGLGYIADREKVKSAVEYILKTNCNKSPYGSINSVRADGNMDTSCQQSENIWPGQCYAFASLAIYEGYKKEGLDVARKVWLHFRDTVKSPWNQPDTLSASTGDFIFGDHYMRNMVIWAILFALKDTEPEAERLLSLLSSRV